jgi:hypothetical protein
MAQRQHEKRTATRRPWPALLTLMERLSPGSSFFKHGLHIGTSPRVLDGRRTRQEPRVTAHSRLRPFWPVYAIPIGRRPRWSRIGRGKMACDTRPRACPARTAVALAGRYRLSEDRGHLRQVEDRDLAVPVLVELRSLVSHACDRLAEGSGYLREVQDGHLPVEIDVGMGLPRTAILCRAAAVGCKQPSRTRCADARAAQTREPEPSGRRNDRDICR